VNGKYFGQPIPRLEDKYLLTGTAKFIDDIVIPGMLHAAFYRSDYAHARITRLDVSEARKRPGVVAVFTAEDFGDYWKPGPLQVPPPTAIAGAQFNARPLLPIAKDKIRFSGEPVAVIIATSRYIAEDAFDDIIFEVEPLPGVCDLEKAWEDTSVLVHDDLPSNMAALVRQEAGNYEEARKNADLVINRRMLVEHVGGIAMENRGFVVNWDEREQEMTVWSTTQAPLPLRGSIARNMNLVENQVRVITPYIGGGFGPKVMSSQADDVLLPWISMKLKAPIKWIEDRRENFLATTSERDQVHYCELAVKKDGTILGFKDTFYHNTGAYNPYGMTVPLNTQAHTVSNYRVPNFATEIRMVFTTQMVVSPVRGADRSQGVHVMERMLDFAARELNITPAEIRLKNLLVPEEFPRPSGIIGQDFVEGVLDSGNYLANLELAMEMIEYDKFINEVQPQARKEGRRLGIGVVTFTEGTSVGPYEGAKVTIGSNGKVSFATGISTQGQGHFTVYAQIVADMLTVRVEDVNVITGDTNYFAWGAGTFASRGAALVGTATYYACQKILEKIYATSSKMFGVPAEEIALEDGCVFVKSQPEKKVTLGELAGRANPSRVVIEPGVEPGLEATAYYAPPHGATGSGAGAMIVEVDPESFKVKIQRFVIVHDCGTVINPLLLDGQIQGAVSMGVGNAFYERLAYDPDGQLLTASFMDYLIPQATDMPPKMELGHGHTRSPLNPLGLKGVGEAGVLPVPPAFAQAVENAFPEVSMEILESNLSPSILYHYYQNAKK